MITFKATIQCEHEGCKTTANITMKFVGDPNSQNDLRSLTIEKIPKGWFADSYRYARKDDRCPIHNIKNVKNVKKSQTNNLNYSTGHEINNKTTSQILGTIVHGRLPTHLSAPGTEAWEVYENSKFVGIADNCNGSNYIPTCKDAYGNYK